MGTVCSFPTVIYTHKYAPHTPHTLSQLHSRVPGVEAGSRGRKRRGRAGEKAIPHSRPQHQNVSPSNIQPLTADTYIKQISLFHCPQPGCLTLPRSPLLEPDSHVSHVELTFFSLSSIESRHGLAAISLFVSWSKGFSLPEPLQAPFPSPDPKLAFHNRYRGNYVEESVELATIQKIHIH